MVQRSDPLNVEDRCVENLARRRVVANSVLGSVIVVCVALFLYPPAQFSFYPICPIHRFLGIECPGCGATRALAALLHGQIAEALRLNALIVLLLPVAVAGAIESYRRAMRPGIFRWPQPPAPTLYGTLATAAVFTVVRNFVR